jgi:hypothetical protein
MLETIKNKIASVRKNLTSLDNQAVGKAALIVIIFLDLFILISIFEGLNDHTRQLSRPGHLIPQYCKDIIIDNDWNKTIRLKRLAQIVSTYHNRTYWQDKKYKSRERHPQCKPIADLFLSIEKDKSLSENLDKFLKNQEEVKQLNSELKRTKSAYDTSLLEKIASQNKETANTDSIKKDVSRKTTAVNKLIQEQGLLESSLVQDPRIRDLFIIIDKITAADRDSLRKDLRNLNFWYPVKRLGMEMIFLLPLFLIFYFWNARSISSNRPFQTLVSTHLLVIVFIPVFFKIIELIYDILPKKLLKNIIEFLESLKLIALWHYLSMAITILLALGLIYFFQKKLFSKEKLINKRISKSLCQDCGKKLPLGASACPFCGFAQFKECSHCQKPTFVYGKFCKACGHGD